MQIFINNLTENTIIISNLNPETTVDELKKSIHKKIKISTELMSLSYGGSILKNDSHILSDYNIQNDSTLRLNIYWNNDFNK